MQNLEQKTENSFFGKIKSGLGEVRHSLAGRIAVYSLAGVLSAGLGYGCGGDKTTAPETYEMNVPETDQSDSEEVEVPVICWEKTFGGSENDKVYSIQQTKDGGYVVAGATKSKGKCSKAWVFKLKQNGELEWDRTYGPEIGVDCYENEGCNEAHSVQQTKDGEYIVAGGFMEELDCHVWVFRLASNGEKKWDKTFGGSENDSAYSIQQTTPDLGYIVAGSIFPATGASPWKAQWAWVLKLYPDGDIDWDKTFGGEGWRDIAHSVQQTKDGGYVVAGETNSKGAGENDAWVFKLKQNGELEWDRTFGGKEEDGAYSIQQTFDGGYIVAGGAWSESPEGSSLDAWILKLKLNGDLEWDKTFGGSRDDWDKEAVSSIQQTKDGGYIAAGYTNRLLNYPKKFAPHAWVFKTKPNGELEWDKTHREGRDWHDSGAIYSIQQTTDGGYVTAGYTVSKGAGGYDARILKLDKNGNLECE